MNERLLARAAKSQTAVTSAQLNGDFAQCFLVARLRRVACGNLMPVDNLNGATLLGGLLDPLSRCLDAESARRVAEFHVDPAIQARIDALAERANDGVLSEEERAEYEAFINTTDLISILKLKVRRQLDSNGR
jgi:hypothetical protein